MSLKENLEIYRPNQRVYVELLDFNIHFTYQSTTYQLQVVGLMAKIKLL
jgi:hypothetical protein